MSVEAPGSRVPTMTQSVELIRSPTKYRKQHPGGQLIFPEEERYKYID